MMVEMVVVGTSTVPPTIYSHSVGVGMPTAMKTKINNMQTIELEPISNNVIQKNIAQIYDKIVKLLPLESLDQNFLTIITKITQVQEGGTTIPRYSLAFDIPQAVKDKINSNNTIRIGSSSLPAVRASPLATVTENEIRFHFIGAKDPYWLEVEYDN
jgi:hypothetical protein